MHTEWCRWTTQSRHDLACLSSFFGFDCPLPECRYHALVCLAAALRLLGEKWPWVKAVRLRADGAAYFRCAASILCAPVLFERTGIKIIEASYTEVGNGKGTPSATRNPKPGSLHPEP